jgi:hypothetical protein
MGCRSEKRLSPKNDSPSILPFKPMLMAMTYGFIDLRTPNVAPVIAPVAPTARFPNETVSC